MLYDENIKEYDIYFISYLHICNLWGRKIQLPVPSEDSHHMRDSKAITLPIARSRSLQTSPLNLPQVQRDRGGLIIQGIGQTHVSPTERNAMRSASVRPTAVQSLSPVWFFATPWTTVLQASLSFTISHRLLKLMSIESVMPSNLLILCHPLLLLLSIFPGIKGLFQQAHKKMLNITNYWA